MIGIDRKPWAFQFWFVHDLILTLLLSPAIDWLLRRFGGWFVAAILVVWVIGESAAALPATPGRARALDVRARSAVLGAGRLLGFGCRLVRDMLTPRRLVQAARC